MNSLWMMALVSLISGFLTASPYPLDVQKVTQCVGNQTSRVARLVHVNQATPLSFSYGVDRSVRLTVKADSQATNAVQTVEGIYFTPAGRAEPYRTEIRPHQQAAPLLATGVSTITTVTDAARKAAWIIVQEPCPSHAPSSATPNTHRMNR